MALSVLPNLPGLTWNVHKKPTFSTLVAPHISGRETRLGLYARALYEFELTYEGLDSAGYYPGLQTQSLQSLMGFYMACRGQLNPFLYIDPTDNAVASQLIGAGDGSTTTFTLPRSLGGYSEPANYVLNPTTPTIYNLAGSGGSANYLPHNLVRNANMIGGGAGVTPTNWTVFSSANGVTMSVVGVGTDGPTGFRYIDLQFSGTGTGSGYMVLQFDSGAVPITAGQAMLTSMYAYVTAGSTPAGGAFFVNDAPSGTNSAYYTNFTATPTRYSILHVASGAATSVVPSFIWYYALGSVFSGTLRVLAPQQEMYLPALQSAPSAFNPTVGAADFGGPNVFVNGAPSLYTFTAPNQITFSSAPASGAILTWTGNFGYQCRFLDDQLDFENFMQGAWAMNSLKFRSIR
jgi:hypothetical protein